jgi:DNA repair protein RadC
MKGARTMDVKFRVSDCGPGESPAKRGESRGYGALSTEELVAILAGGKEVSEKLMLGSSLRGLSQMCSDELKRRGVGPAGIARLRATFEVARRIQEDCTAEVQHLSGAEEAYQFLKPRLRDLPHEVFAAIFLTQKHGVISHRELFRGSVHGSAIHPREVIKQALADNAAAVILAHNHPSGHVSPSPDDLRLTEELRCVLNHSDVRVIDHLIVGGNGYFSFAREGMLS